MTEITRRGAEMTDTKPDSRPHELEVLVTQGGTSLAVNERRMLSCIADCHQYLADNPQGRELLFVVQTVMQNVHAVWILELGNGSPQKGCEQLKRILNDPENRCERFIVPTSWQTTEIGGIM